ncbi:MAG: hypothetical protein ACI9K2_004714, partial [Myxococcota bacterium]
LEPRLDQESILGLAREFSVPAGQIAAALKRTGKTRRPRGATPEALPPEPEEAAQDSRAGSKSHLVEAYGHMLGKVPDAEVAKLAKVSTRTVAAYRARHKIVGYDRWSDPKRERKQNRGSRIDPFRELVGVKPDSEVAKLAGVSPQAVRNFRAKNGIPAPGRAASKPAAPKKAAAPVKAPTTAAKKAPAAAKNAPAAAKASPAPAKKAPAPAKKPAAVAKKAPAAAEKAPAAAKKAAPAPAVTKPAAAPVAKAPVAPKPVVAAKPTPQAKATPAPVVHKAPSAPPVAAPVALAPAAAPARSGWGWRVTFASGEQRVALAVDVGALVAAFAASGHGPVVGIERLEKAL